MTTYKHDTKNANLGTDRGKDAIRESIKRLGAGRSIVVDKNGVIIAGNKTYEQAKALGLDVQEISTKGDTLIVVKREDLDLEQDAKARELAYADNRTVDLDLNWDAELLKEGIENFDLSYLWSEQELNHIEKILHQQDNFVPVYSDEDEIEDFDYDGDDTEALEDGEPWQSPTQYPQLKPESMEGEENQEGARERELEERENANPERFPLAIVLSWGDYQRWKDWKEECGCKRDTPALLALMDGKV